MTTDGPNVRDQPTVPVLVPGVSAWEHHKRYGRLGNVGVLLALTLVASAGLLSDPWKPAGIVMCFFGMVATSVLQYRETQHEHQRLRIERAAGYTTLGGGPRADLPLLDARTGKLLREAIKQRS